MSRRAIALAISALFVWSAPWLTEAALAQAADPGTADEGQPKHGLHDFSPLILPIPISDPAIGNGLALAGGGLYQVGEEERPWITGAAGLYADTKSYAFAVFHRSSFGGDKIRVQGGVGGGVFNVDFFGIGQAAGARGVAIPITQKGKGARVEGYVRVRPHLFAGLEYRYVDLETTIRFLPPPFPDMDVSGRELNSTVSALGLAGEYDSRDEEFEPRAGAYASATLLRSAQALGSDFDYTRLEASANWYRAAGSKGVIAWRVSGCWSGDGAPFFDICNYGSTSDLRGYTAGQYRDHALLATQVEYRRRLSARWGGVAFAGVGGVANEFGDIFAHPLPAGGVGVRFKASRRYDVNVGIDYAVGKDSDAFYFRVGEAF